MAPVLGIDLGTTNSVVCVAAGGNVRVLPDGDGNLLIPSVVSFHPAGDVLVGHSARERRLLDARNTVYSVKRLIGRPFRSPEVRRAQERFPFELCEGPTEGVLVRARGETYTLPEISAFVLREVRRIAEEGLNESCTQAVITVPANFNELQRSATKAAGRVAGLEVLRILNEPTAAALAYGYGRGSRERIAVFDLGGGTFDITILELAGDVFEVLSTAGDTFLGGDDIDVLIAEKMADAFLEHHRFDPRQDAQAYERLRAAAEWAKCQLSSEPEVQLRIEELAYGEGGASLDLTFGMTRAALESLVRPLVGRAFDVCEDAMRVAGLRPTTLDNIILVGGSTRMPLVRGMVAEYFGREPLVTIDPDLVVARGAALQAAALAPERPEPSGPKQLARVALKRMSMQDLAAAKTRREELADEAKAARPAQPAFQPARAPVPMWDDVDELPTRIAKLDARSEDEQTQVGSGPDDLVPPTEARTRVASGLDELMPQSEQPTAALASPYRNDDEELPEEPTQARTRAGASAWTDGARPAAGGAPSDDAGPSAPPKSDVVKTSKQVAIGQVALESRPIGAPPPTPPTPPKAGRPAPRGRPGFSTLGYGSEGLQVPEDLESKSPPQGQPAPPQQAPPPPPQPPAPPQQAAAPPQQAAASPQQAPAPPSPPPQAAPPVPPAAPPSASWGASPPSGSGPPPGLPPARGPVGATQPMPVAPGRAPLLLDVTPHTLGIETVGGYCEGVITRNAAIPVEQTRIFSTGQDDQDSVSVRIFQGEARRLDENQPLGQVELTGLRRAARGDVHIEVTFLMDADGTLGVRARDQETGREQTVRINLVGGVGDEEIQRMRERQARMVGAG